MELEELKNAWVSVDERLKKQEILKGSIIKEMIYSKTDKSLKRLFWSDGISIPLGLALIPFLVYAYGKLGGKSIFWDSTIIFAGVFCITYLPFLVYRVYGLMKIDISGNIKDNLFHINQYNIWIKREKRSMAFIGPLVLILVSLNFIERKANVFLWTFWICTGIFLILYSYWSYNKFYGKNIQSIQKNLEALKELEE
jgi:hypothetical protein